MKKVASLLLALTIAFAFSAGAFAADEIPPMANTAPGAGNFVETEPGVGRFIETTPGAGTTLADTAAESATPGDFRISNYALGLVEEGKVDISKGDTFFVQNKKILVPELLLEPGTEYTFDIYYAVDDVTGFEIENDLTDSVAVPLTKKDLGDAKMRVRASKGGSSISSTDIKTKGIGDAATYHVDIETKDTYNTKQVDVVYAISFTGTPATTPINNNDIAFIVGHGKMTEDEIESYDEGEEVVISNDAPIITKKLLDTLAKNYKYKSIPFVAEDDSWEYTGRVSGMADTNFYYTQDVIPSIMSKFDQDFKFLLFPAGVTFPTNGEMRIDVSDVSDDWDRIYTYLYRNGTLTPINTTYDGSSDQIIFRTNYLGAFVMTDVEITDTTILNPGTNNEISGAPESGEPVEPTTPVNPNNPNTGMPAGMNLLVSMGALSLLTAGTAIIRKRK